jgi:hypothetical protein
MDGFRIIRQRDSELYLSDREKGKFTRKKSRSNPLAMSNLAGSSLGQDALNNLSMYVGQTIVSSLLSER